MLVAHNAPFDVGFLKVAVARLGIEVPALTVLDTLNLSRCLVDGVNDYKLKTLGFSTQKSSMATITER